MKITNNIKRYSTYLVLSGYLLILFTGAIHFHKIDFQYLSTIDISGKTSNISGDNYFSCPIEFAFNSIHNTTVNQVSLDEKKTNYSEYFQNDIYPSEIKKEFYSHFSLRAPPKSL